MNLIFFISSNTVNVQRFNPKDIPGSSGRLDVISRCVLASLLNYDDFDYNVEIWVFLKNYGTYIFRPSYLDITTFPKSEILFSRYFVNYIKNEEDVEENAFSKIEMSSMGLIDALNFQIDRNYRAFILEESGIPFLDYYEHIKANQKFLFLIGDQSGKIIEPYDLIELKLPILSLGVRSYLASTAIRLIKMILFHKFF